MTEQKGTPFWSRQVLNHQGGPERLTERYNKPKQIDWSTRYPNEVFLRGRTKKKQVALSFDDGPDDYWTPLILDALLTEGVKATFMCVGQRVNQNPKMMERIMKEGHVVGNHTWSHPNLTKISRNEIQKQVIDTDKVIQQTAGVVPMLMRPPYGAINDAVIQEMISLKKKIIYWDVDSLDWAGLTAPQVVANILSHVTPGAIVLQHFAGGEGESLADTVQSIPYVIHTLRDEGYTFSTIPQQLNLKAYV